MINISVCAIVKNEEKNIEKLLQSIKPYGFEIIVVDTGSTDATKDIAAKYTDKVYDFEWCNDFSAAKNYASSLASNNWILSMDADEWIDSIDLEEVDYFIKKYPNAMGSVYIDNLTGTPTKPGPISRIHIERLYDRRRYHFVQPIHEMLAPKYTQDMEDLLVNIVIGHSGYCIDDETRAIKSKRNLDLLYNELETDPDNAYTLFQIGKAYQMVYNHELTYKYFKQAIDLKPDEELYWVSVLKKEFEAERKRLNITNSIKDKISVIIPCYNVEKYIDRCLISVTEQTYGIDNIEIICIDDHSSDETLTKLMEWESKFPENIMVIPLENNGRQGRARNVGLDYSTGKWIAFIDSDDWVEPDYLDKMYAYTNNGQTDIIECKLLRDENASPIPQYLSPDTRKTNKDSRALLIDSDSKREMFIVLQPIAYSACYRLIRRDFLIDNNLYFPENVAYEDTAWGNLVNLHVKSAYILEETLYHYFINTASTVLNKDMSYHEDLLSVQEYKWDMWHHMNIYSKYEEALIYEHISSCYLSFLKILALRYDNPPYDLFIKCKNMINSEFSDCRNNKYINECLPDFHKTLINLLYMNINEEAFLTIINAIRSHGGL